VSYHCAGPEAADGEGLHLSFPLKLSLLSLRECDNLLDINWFSLETRTTIDVQLEAALDVPFDLLALQAFK
jgi:hypothetical protein